MEDQTRSTADVKDLEERLLQGCPAFSLEELADLLAEGFIEFGSSGNVYNKKNVIEGLADETDREITMSDLEQVVLASDIVLLRYQVRQHFPDGSVKHSLRSSLWQLIDDRWQIVFHQGTTIPHVTES